VPDVEGQLRIAQSSTARGQCAAPMMAGTEVIGFVRHEEMVRLGHDVTCSPRRLPRLPKPNWAAVRQWGFPQSEHSDTSLSMADARQGGQTEAELEHSALPYRPVSVPHFRIKWQAGGLPTIPAGRIFRTSSRYMPVS